MINTIFSYAKHIYQQWNKRREMERSTTMTLLMMEKATSEHLKQKVAALSAAQESAYVCWLGLPFPAQLTEEQVIEKAKDAAVHFVEETYKDGCTQMLSNQMIGMMFLNAYANMFGLNESGGDDER